MNCLGVIPVRLSSTRLPNKPLKDIAGKSLVERVWLQAKKANSISKLVIATEDLEIQKAANDFGAEVVFTSNKPLTGSDRVAEALSILEKRGEKFDFAANIQGDMPFINPIVIDRVVQGLQNSNLFEMATIAIPILDQEQYQKTSCVKVAIGAENRALYFSRATIPFWRNPDPNEIINAQNPLAYKHVGLYVFKNSALKKMSSLEQVFVEKRESLEQLRALAHGINIKVEIIQSELMQPNIEVDTPEDLELANQLAKQFKI